MCKDDDISIVQQRHPYALLAVDVTSIAGIRELRIADADVWLFSVQKCFGLPAGLGILIVSSRAMERAKLLMDTKRIIGGVRHLTAMWEKMKDVYQTIDTPNILAIHLLGCQLKRWNADGGITKRQQQALEKKLLLDIFIASSKYCSHFVESADHRSLSVACVQAESSFIHALHERTRQQDVIIGSGYGKLKGSTFRIANFPAITQPHMQSLIELLRVEDAILA